MLQVCEKVETKKKSLDKFTPIERKRTSDILSLRIPIFSGKFVDNAGSYVQDFFSNFFPFFRNSLVPVSRFIVCERLSVAWMKSWKRNETLFEVKCFVFKKMIAAPVASAPELNGYITTDDNELYFPYFEYDSFCISSSHHLRSFAFLSANR